MRAHAGVTLDLLAQRLGTLNEASRAHAEAVLSDARRCCRGSTRSGSPAREPAHSHPRRLSPRPGAAHRGRFRHPRLRGGTGATDSRAAREAVGAQGRRRDDPLYSYAAYAALFAYSVHAPGQYALLEPWAETWQHWAADAFLKGYLAAIEQEALLPREMPARRALLSAFVLDKALYELDYELNNRPDWVRIPLIGIRKLIGA
jgi:hypothetical protein